MSELFFGLIVLQARQTEALSGFFNVQRGQSQDSPLASVLSKFTVILPSFEPPHTSHASLEAGFTRVHFLQVHSISTVGASSVGKY